MRPADAGAAAAAAVVVGQRQCRISAELAGALCPPPPPKKKTSAHQQQHLAGTFPWCRRSAGAGGWRGSTCSGTPCNDRGSECVCVCVWRGGGHSCRLSGLQGSEGSSPGSPTPSLPSRGAAALHPSSGPPALPAHASRHSVKRHPSLPPSFPPSLTPPPSASPLGKCRPWSKRWAAW